MEIQQHEVYNLVGGDSFFKKLIDVFYAKIEKNSILRPLFPNGLENGKKWNYLFLVYLFGGPDTYIKERGNPRMRRRHLPFSIGLEERNQWVKLMLTSLNDCGINEQHPAWSNFKNRLEFIATKIINKPVELNINNDKDVVDSLIQF